MGPATQRRRLPAAVRPRTVAVLPFSNISGAADDDWIGTGIAETVTVSLLRIDALSVVDHSAFVDVLSQSEATPTSTRDALARDVALGLDVAWLVTGSFQRLPDEMRVTARILNVETGATSEVVTIDGQPDQLFDVQDRLVDELSDGFVAIAGTLASAPARVARDTPTDSAELGEGVGLDGFTQPTRSRGRAPSLGNEPAGPAVIP